MTDRSERLPVLMVDDDEATCTLIGAILRHDFLVEIASDGTEAIEKIRTKRYAAILLDLRMPHGDGFTVLDFIRANHPAVISRIVIVTASVGEREQKQLDLYGVCTVIRKPFEVEVLREAVRACAEDADSSGLPLFCAGPAMMLLFDLITRGQIR